MRLAWPSRRAVLGDRPGLVMVDVDDTIVEVHGYAKQGAGFGYSKVRGLNALLATATTVASAPVVVAQRLRRGACGSPRGAKRLVADAVTTVSRLVPGRPVLLRADSAFYGSDTVGAAIRAGADVSVTVRQDPRVKATIGEIADDVWTPIAYREAVFDETTGRWVSRAEVAEIPLLRSHPGRRPSECRAGWWCDGSPTSTLPGKTGCSTRGGSTPSSPPPTRPCWTRWPPTSCTAAMLGCRPRPSTSNC